MYDLELYRLILTIAERLRQRGSWTGETHIQKVGYFLQELLGVRLKAEYILYKHGPYSFDLHQTLGAMRALQFADWRPNPDPYGPTFVEGPLSNTLKRFTTEPVEYDSRIDFAAEWLGPKRVAELERLGTALYVTLQDPNAQNRPALICELKPHVTPADAEASVSELDKLISRARVQDLVSVRSMGVCEEGRSALHEPQRHHAAGS